LWRAGREGQVGTRRRFGERPRSVGRTGQTAVRLSTNDGWRLANLPIRASLNFRCITGI
jgi:hypothetical protein